MTSRYREAGTTAAGDAVARAVDLRGGPFQYGSNGTNYARRLTDSLLWSFLAAMERKPF